MGSVYEFSRLTIAAAGADNAHKGCFANRDPLRFLPCRIVSNEFGNIYTAFEEAHMDLDYEVKDKSRWIQRMGFSRAYTFQSDPLLRQKEHVLVLHSRPGY